MRSSSRLLALVGAFVLLLLTSVHAHSQARGPLSRLSLVEFPRIHTAGRRVQAHSKFDVSFDLQGFPARIKFALEPNHDVLGPGASVQYLNADGEVERIEAIRRHEHKIYKGTAWVEMAEDDWMQVGWARVSMLRDGSQPVFEGVFTVNHDHHHIQTGSFYKSTRHILDPELEWDEEEEDAMVVFRDSDILRVSPNLELRGLGDDLGCSYGKMAFNANPDHAVFQQLPSVGSWGAASFGSLLGKRQSDTPSGGNGGGVNLKSSIGNPAGCPTSRKVALIGIATDCSYTASFNSTSTVRSNVINQINSASHVYESTFNISLGLQNLTISTSSCPGTAAPATPWNLPCSTSNITDRLNTFSSWRGSHPDDNAYWTMLTDCPTGSEVGLAWLGQLCTNTAQAASGETVTGANVVAKTSTEWQVIAHESGHTFGAVHDCDSQTCADSSIVNSQQCCPLSNSTCDAGGQYIMNPSTGDGITQFSPCTVGNICSALGRNSVKSTCLSDNKDITTISGHECGNGIVEDGEECDCGGTEGCDGNTCCDPTTCKFTTGSVCDDSNEDCCSGCQFASNGTVCRAGNGVCDPQEVCSGSNATCPDDATAPNGQGCGSGLACASGQCTSRDLQCKTLMGSYTSNNDTYACDSSDCTLTCASPDFGPNTCYSMQQNFLDGTPCGGGGSCSNGACEGDSLGGEISSWVSQNEPLVIGLSAGIGGLLLLSILSCVWRSCRRRRRLAKLPPGAAMAQRQGWSGDAALYPNGQQWPGQQQWQRGQGAQPPPQAWGSPQNWGSQEQWNGRPNWPAQGQGQPPEDQRTYSTIPPIPPNRWGYGGHSGQSVRYA